MKSVRIDKEEVKKEKPSPKLMRFKSWYNDFIVMMTEKISPNEAKGTVVNVLRGIHRVGTIRSDWNFHRFEDYDGKVVLSNE